MFGSNFSHHIKLAAEHNKWAFPHPLPDGVDIIIGDTIILFSKETKCIHLIASVTSPPRRGRKIYNDPWPERWHDPVDIEPLFFSEQGVYAKGALEDVLQKKLQPRWITNLQSLGILRKFDDYRGRLDLTDLQVEQIGSMMHA